jgi:hypothetical protein
MILCILAVDYFGSDQNTKVNSKTPYTDLSIVAGCLDTLCLIPD